MTPDDLAAAGRALYGARWQSQLARDLRVTDRTVRRWFAGVTSIPAQVEVDLQALLAARHSAISGMTRMLPTTETAPSGALHLEEAVSPGFAGRNARAGLAGPLHGFMRGTVVIPADVDLTAPVVDEPFDVETGALPE